MPIFSKLQNKTPKEKRRLLWISVCTSTVIIFILWITVFPKDYLGNNEGQKSLTGLKDEFYNSEENQEFDQYMDSLKILDNFEENFNLESIIQNEQNDTLQNETSIEDIFSSDEDREMIRLPLEKD